MTVRPALLFSVALVCFASVACVACASSDADVPFKLVRHGGDVLADLDDLEAARAAFPAWLERTEELVRLEPGRAELRELLVKGWARYALLIVEDDLEEARERGDGPLSGYHAMRARNAYERAVHHGRALLGQGFDAAVGDGSMAAFLAAKKPPPEAVLWLGAAWLGRVRVATEDRRQLSAQAPVGEALLEHAASSLRGSDGSWAQLMLGWQRARAGDADRAKQHLDKALEIGGRKLLFAQIITARTVVCQAQDRERWDALVAEVLAARDPSPELRLDNAVAKRKASRDGQGMRRTQCVPP